MEKTITLKPYDDNVADAVFNVLFTDTGYGREDHLTEIPSASYQLVVSAMECILWELDEKEERNAIIKARNIVELLMDEQKVRELKRIINNC